MAIVFSVIFLLVVAALYTGGTDGQNVQGGMPGVGRGGDGVPGRPVPRVLALALAASAPPLSVEVEAALASARRPLARSSAPSLGPSHGDVGSGAVHGDHPRTLASVAAPALGHGRTKHSHRFEIAAALAKALRPWPLGRYTWQLEASAHRWNVNPYLIAGIAKLESTYGAAACGPDYWGFNTCNSRPWSTVQEGIEYVTRHIRLDYMNKWGLRDTVSIGNKWCSCGSQYGYKLVAEMRRIGGPSTAVYP